MAFSQYLNFNLGNTEGPQLPRILGLEKNVLREFRVSGTVGVPYLHKNPPKTAVVGSVVVETA